LARVGLSEELPRVEDEVPAVRAVQRAGTHEREVGDERAEVRMVLDAAHEV
jgi:hypothetical protein